MSIFLNKTEKKKKQRTFFYSQNKVLPYNQGEKQKRINHYMLKEYHMRHPQNGIISKRLLA